jgi:hypothetical protein
LSSRVQAHAPPSLPAQANFGKAFLPLSHWISNCGEEVVACIEAMEHATADKKQGVTLNSFKVLEGFRVPEDYETLLGKMRACDKPTPALLLTYGREILLERWWKWTLEHPDLPENRIHPSRRMLNPPPSPWEGAVPLPPVHPVLSWGSVPHPCTEARDRVSRKYLCGEDPQPVL